MKKLEKYPFIQAKYFSSRAGLEPEIIVLHYTAGSGNAQELANFFSKGDRKASAHFGIGRINQSIKGETTNIIQMVDLDQNAWHPGLSKFKDGKGNIGRRSIGIEICNRGFNVDGLPDARVGVGRHRNKASTASKWEKYTDLQYDSLCELIQELKNAYPSIKYITSHEDIRNPYVVEGLKGAKLDTGPLFKWEKLSNILEQCQIEEWHFGFKNKIWYKGLASE